MPRLVYEGRFDVGHEIPGSVRMAMFSGQTQGMIRVFTTEAGWSRWLRGAKVTV